MWIVSVLVGIVCVLLGGLWLVQGLGLVNIPPLLCVAECAPIEGGSPTWAVIGSVVLLVGVAAVVLPLRRRLR